MRKLKNNFLIIFILATMLIACAGQQSVSKNESAVNALLLTKDVIVGIAQSADILCTAGTLNQTQCNKLGQYYERAKIFYNITESSLETAVANDEPGAWATYNALHENFNQVYNDLIAIAVEFGVDTTGGK